MTFRELGAPTISQNAALPAEVAMPTPDGPPFTSLVTSMLSAWPASALMPRSFGLREQRMVSQAVILQEVLQRARAAAESQRVDRQHGDFRIHVVARDRP